MLERIMKLLSSLKIDSLVQGALFLLLLISVYWFLPGLALLLLPLAGIEFVSKNVYDFVKSNVLNICKN
jgi:hypothetical protein